MIWVALYLYVVGAVSVSMMLVENDNAWGGMLTPKGLCWLALWPVIIILTTAHRIMFVSSHLYKHRFFLLLKVPKDSSMFLS